MGHIYHYASRVAAYAGHTEGSTWDNLLEQPYFERLWPVQELLHARTIRVYYGKLSADWDSVSQRYEQHAGGSSGSSTTSTSSSTSRGSKTANFFGLRKWYNEQPNPRPQQKIHVDDQREIKRLRSVGRLDTRRLVTLLRMTAELKCAQPLDKFYAAQSLFDGDLYERIQPVYTKSLRNLRAEIVSIMGQKYKEELRALLQTP